MTTRLLAGALVLVCSGRFNAQPSTRPLSYAAIIGASDFDNAQIPRIPAAEASTRDLGKALEAAGIPARNIYSQIKGEANSHAVQTALRAVLKDRVTAADSVLVFIAGSGRIEAANGRREAYLLTQESNPGAKRTTAFQLSDLGMWVKDSPAAIYLIVDLTGDPIPELSDIAKSPRVLLSAVASASSPDLPLAKAAGDALTKGASGRSLNAGSLLESLRGVPAIQTTLAPQQVSAALFEPPQQIGPPPPTPRPGGVPTQATQPGGTQVRVDKPVSPSLENARAQYQKRNCREAKSILASANGSDPAVGELNALVDACLLKQTSLDQYRALPLLTASLADLQRALAAVQSALAKNPNDTELGQAATELQLRVQYASAVAQLQVYPEGTVKGIAGFIAAAKASPQPIQARLQPLITEAQKTSGVASVQSTLKQAEALYGLRDTETARHLLSTIQGDETAQKLLKQIDDQYLQKRLADALANGKAAKARGDWTTAVNEFSRAKEISHGLDPEANQELQQALAAATAQRAQRLSYLLGAAIAGLVLTAIALVLAFSPKRRAELLYKFGWAARAARLYAQYGDSDRALLICRSQALVRPEDNEIRRVAADIQFSSRDEAGAAESYFELMRRGHGDEAMYGRVLELLKHLDTATMAIDRESVANLILHALERHPGSPSLESALACLYGAGDRGDAQALAIYSKAAAHEKGNRDLLCRLTRGEYRRQSYSDAFRWAKQALAAEARDAEVIDSFIGAGQALGSLPEALDFLVSLRLDTVYTLLLYEGIAEKAPDLRSRVQALYHDKIKEVDGNLRDRALLEAHIAIGENRLHDAEALLGTVTSNGDSGPVRRILISAYRRILAGEPKVPGELALHLARLHGESGDINSAAELLSAAIKIPEAQKAATSLLEEIYEAAPMRQVAVRLFNAAGWTISETPAGLVASGPRGGVHAEFENCLVAVFTDPVRVAHADDMRALMLNDSRGLNARFAFLVAKDQPRHEVYAFLYSLPSDERPVWIVPLDAPAVRKALVREEARAYLERQLELWRGRVDLYKDHDAIMDPARFFGRERYFNELTHRIASHENFGIFGIRKIGKTSLAAQLRWNLQHELVGFADAQKVASSGVEEVYFLLIQSVLEDARRKFPSATFSPPRLSGFDPRNDYPHITTDFAQDLTQILQDVQAVGRNPRLLLVIDEIELLVPYGSSPGKRGYEDFFRTLRGLHQTNNQIVSAIMGADPSHFRMAVWGERDNPVFQYYEEVFLTGFDRMECDAMIEGIGRLMGIEYTPESLALIYSESGGHPFVARQLASSLVGRYPVRPPRVEPPMVETAIEDYLLVKGSYFEGIFKGNSLSQAALEVLAESARIGRNEISREDLAASAARRGIARMELDSALRDLELFGLFVRERHSYSFRTQLLRRWIRRSWLDIE